MNSSKKNKKGNSFFPKDIETRTGLIELMRKSHKEINKNKLLNQTILFNQTQLKKIKKILSKFLSYEKLSNKNASKEIENQLTKLKEKLIKYKESLFYEIKCNKEKMNINSIMLDKNTKQQLNVLDSLKNKNFILENNLKEKDSLIERLKIILCDAILNFHDVEIIKNIEPDYLANIEKNQTIIETDFLINREYYNQFLLYKLMKFNKIKNKAYKLNEKKNELLNTINEYYHKNNKFENIIKDKPSLEKNITKDNFDISNDIIIPTNVSTNGSILNMNDSLYFDTEEQIDIKLPENDFSSFFSSQKSLSLNTLKKNIYIPPLNIELIKNNMKNEESSSEEKSLSRILENDLDYKIKKMKKQIKSYKRQNDNLDKKCKKYENKIKQIALLLYFESKNDLSINNTNDN